MVAIEVAEMESTIQFLREEVRDLEKRIAAAEAENAMLRARCEEADETAHTELVRSTTMKATMTQMSALLLSGLKQMEDEVSRERAERAEKEARRLEQERAILKEGGDAPLFLTGAREPREVHKLACDGKLNGVDKHSPDLDEQREQRSTGSKLPTVDLNTISIESDIEKLAKLGEPDGKDI